MRLFVRGLVLIVFVVLLAPEGGLAQETTGTIEGQITDAETEEPLERANIVFRQEGQTPGTSTDEDGCFQYSLASGEYQVEVTSLGWKP